MTKRLILCQNYISCAPNVVIVWCDFSNWQHEFFQYLVASHMPDSGWLPAAPGSVIKVSYFSTDIQTQCGGHFWNLPFQQFGQF